MHEVRVTWLDVCSFFKSKIILFLALFSLHASLVSFNDNFVPCESPACIAAGLLSRLNHKYGPSAN